MCYSIGMLEKEYYYEPTDTTLHVLEHNLLLVRFGRATLDVEENTIETQWIDDTLRLMLSELEGDVYIMLDLSKVGDAEHISDESKMLYVQMIKEKRIKKIAIFGWAKGWDLYIKLFQFYAKNKLKAFTTEKQAREWLIKHGYTSA